jgi:hypothetical protein
MFLEARGEGLCSPARAAFPLRWHLGNAMAGFAYAIEECVPECACDWLRQIRPGRRRAQSRMRPHVVRSKPTSLHFPLLMLLKCLFSSSLCAPVMSPCQISADWEVIRKALVKRRNILLYVVPIRCLQERRRCGCAHQRCKQCNGTELRHELLIITGHCSTPSANCYSFCSLGSGLLKQLFCLLFELNSDLFKGSN